VDGKHCKMRSFMMYFSSDIIKVIKSKRMRWAGHVACMKSIENLFEKPDDTRPLRNLCADWRIILKWIVKI
jgi:hypothetical protein